jgi:hypothetical protein
LTLSKLSTFTEIIHSSRVVASIVSIHLRSEVALIEDGSAGVLKKGIVKEVDAAMNPRSTIIQYGALFNPEDNKTWVGIHRPLSPSWAETARLFTTRLSGVSRKLNYVIYPALQRRKNMSRESCQLLASYGYKREGAGPWDYCTADLERFYHETGIMVGGEIEMRWAWRFNDLKPRAYYCVGGDQYWPSRYVKPIAVEFMELLPISSKSRRSFPADAARYVEEDDFVVIWDLGSFTTNLAELRLFLWWVCRYLEDDLPTRQNLLRLFDYRQGIVTTSLWELLDNYNSEVNCQSSFSIYRVLDQLGLSGEDSVPETRHQNSGALGVLGNIGFSTSFGGVHTALTAKHYNAGSSIGDDVLAITTGDPIHTGFIEHIEAIGVIATDKYEGFPPQERYDEDSGWKFVKRPFRRTHDGFSIGDQLNIPILAYVYCLESPNRKFPSTSDRSRIVHKFASQVASLLWDVQKSTLYVSDHDILTIRHYLRPAYRHLGIPSKGALPGYVLLHDPDNVVLRLAIPSINFRLYDPRFEDWSEYLWNSAPQPFAVLPQLSPVPIFLEGEEVEIVTSTRFNRVWVDLGYYVETKRLKTVVEVSSLNLRVFQSLLRGEGLPVVEYVRVKSLPAVFHETMQKLKGLSVRSGWHWD